MEAQPAAAPAAAAPQVAAAPGAAPSEPAKDTDRQLRLRLCVLNEILGTERDYVCTLRFLQSAFLHRIRQSAVDKAEKYITEDNIKVSLSEYQSLCELFRAWQLVSKVLGFLLMDEPFLDKLIKLLA
uniref:DH domain-containing protein n=1 Tax=Podarcis muralis TaxID=64176 RepID=A0A670ISE5_PODMU